MFTVEELAARESIRDCLYRYCRAIDRGDESALRDVFWPDATDQHGAEVITAQKFILFALQVVRATEPGIHQLHNILIELEPDRAFVESYFSAWQQLPDGKGFRHAHQKGRYVDQFERRDSIWKIKARTVIFDKLEPGVAPNGSAGEETTEVLRGLHYPRDPVYTLNPAKA